MAFSVSPRLRLASSVRRALAIAVIVGTAVGQAGYSRGTRTERPQPRHSDLASINLDGRPVVAWREENGCGGTPRAFWTRNEGGVWTANEFLSERRYSGGAKGDAYHQLILRPSDGNPFLVYRDVGPFSEFNTYRTDLGQYPNGGVSTYLEGLVGPQNCGRVNYSLAFARTSDVPEWASAQALCSGGGPIRLDGTVVELSTPENISVRI